MNIGVVAFAKLTFREKMLFTRLMLGRPVKIEKLFAAVNQTPGVYTVREMQQRLGKAITAINRAIEHSGYRAVPGEPRGTYRIREIQQ